jgi:hypothetical protein
MESSSVEFSTIPTRVIVDQGGTVLDVHVGYSPTLHEELIRAFSFHHSRNLLELLDRIEHADVQYISNLRREGVR